MSRMLSTAISEHSTSEQSKKGTTYRLSGIVLLLGAIAVWVSSRFTWATVVSQDDKAGSTIFAITGSQWSAEVTVCALLFLVGAIAVFFLGSLGRRIIGGMSALVAAVAMISPVRLLVSGGDPEHARLVLASDSSLVVSTSSSSLHPWAVVDSVDVAFIPVLCALLGLCLAFLGACLVIWRPGSRHREHSRFTRRAVQTETRHDEVSEEPESDRALWDALDSGCDPTADISLTPTADEDPT